MNIRRAILSLIALILIIVVLPLVTYRADATELTIDTISRQTETGANQAPSPKIQVITSPPLNPVPDILAADQSAIQAVDYSNNIVIIAFFGSGSSAQDRVLNVYQFKSVVWVRSQISNTSTDANNTDNKNYYQIIKVDKSGMPGYGNITFRLLSGFEEKARIVETISPVVYQ